MAAGINQSWMPNGPAADTYGWMMSSGLPLARQWANEEEERRRAASEWDMEQMKKLTSPGNMPSITPTKIDIGAAPHPTAYNMEKITAPDLGPLMDKVAGYVNSAKQASLQNYGQQFSNLVGQGAKQAKAAGMRAGMWDQGPQTEKMNSFLQSLSGQAAQGVSNIEANALGQLANMFGGNTLATFTTQGMMDRIQDQKKYNDQLQDYAYQNSLYQNNLQNNVNAQSLEQQLKYQYALQNMQNQMALSSAMKSRPSGGGSDLFGQVLNAAVGTSGGKAPNVSGMSGYSGASPYQGESNSNVSQLNPDISQHFRNPGQKENMYIANQPLEALSAIAGLFKN
jgi:hypothetical protein